MFVSYCLQILSVGKLRGTGKDQPLLTNLTRGKAGKKMNSFGFVYPGGAWNGTQNVVFRSDSVSCYADQSPQWKIASPRSKNRLFALAAHWIICSFLRDLHVSPVLGEGRKKKTGEGTELLARTWYWLTCQLEHFHFYCQWSQHLKAPHCSGAAKRVSIEAVCLNQPMLFLGN